MPDIGFINGRFMPLEAAAVSVEDRGFQFGDGVYEVIRTYRGTPFQLDAHLSRLERSANAIELKNPFLLSDWKGFIAEGIRRAGYPESKIYIQLTRGAAPRDHAYPLDVRPTAVMTTRAMQSLDPALQSTGVRVITVEDFRWGRCDIKSLNLLPNIMARQRAKTAGAFEAVFVRDGLVTEGAVSNVMLVKHGALLTAPEDQRILSGVTRALILEVARKEGVPVEERAVGLREFYEADEVFLTGTTVEVLPVVRIDDLSVGQGRRGPLTARLGACFRALMGP